MPMIVLFYAYCLRLKQEAITFARTGSVSIKLVLFYIVYILYSIIYINSSCLTILQFLQLTVSKNNSKLQCKIELYYII